jgi:hypothetical protein
MHESQYAAEGVVTNLARKKVKSELFISHSHANPVVLEE